MGLSSWGYGGTRSPMSGVRCDPMWQVTLQSSVMDSHNS